MTTVLEEVTSDTLQKEDIEKRIDDWKKRLNSLYKEIEGWLPEGWKAEKGLSMDMREELMRKHGVRKKKIPTLLLRGEEGKEAELEPRELWIVGANGRVDLKYDGRHYLIVDMAENFKPSRWTVFDLDDSADNEILSEKWLHGVLQ